MVIRFETFGPFQLPEMTGHAIDNLYTQFSKVDKGLQYAIGVYIFAAQDSSGKPMPWYVGKTKDQFGNRLQTHFKSDWIYKLANEVGGLSLFLLPRVTPTGRVMKRVLPDKNKSMPSIDRLEWALIGACRAKNPALINKQGSKFFDSLVVPGYSNSPVTNSSSADALSNLLMV